MWNLFSSSVNKCTIMIITINVKSFLERYFCEISINSFRKQMYFYEKKNMFCIQPLWSTAKLERFYAIYLVLTKEMAQKWDLWHELLKSTSKIWRPSYAWMTWYRQQAEGINYTFKYTLTFDKFWQKYYLSL